MNRQPTSIHDFLGVVLLMQYPGLIETDKLILVTLAWAGDWHTGEHAYPGLQKLGRAAAGKDGPKDRRTIQRRLRWLEEQGLIKCTAHRRGGQGKASEYRICLEHPAFQIPDNDPDLERHNGAAVNEELERHDGAAVSNKLERHEDRDRAAPPSDYSGTGAFLERHNGAAPSEPPSEAPSNSSSEALLLQSRRSSSMSSLRDAAVPLSGQDSSPKEKTQPKIRPWVYTIWRERNAPAILNTHRTDPAALEKLIASYDEQTVALAWYEYVGAEPPPYNLEAIKVAVKAISKAGKEWVDSVDNTSSITRFPLMVFLKRPDDYIAEAQHDMKNPGWRKTMKSIYGKEIANEVFGKKE